MSAPPARAPERLEHGALGVSSIVFFVVAAAAPLTVMAGIAPLAAAVRDVATEQRADRILYLECVDRD